MTGDQWTLENIYWDPAHRIVPSHYPPINLFETVSDPADLETVWAVESLTNPRLREEAGEISLVAEEDRIAGPGTSPIMAAFTHPNQDGSRFSNGEYGVYYAADTLETAIAETRFHSERLMSYQEVGPQNLYMRVYLGAIHAEMVDIRRRHAELPHIYDLNDYGSSQLFGKARWSEGRWGIVYTSVRHPEGECVAVFKPRACSPVRQGEHLLYAWDGYRITHVASVHEMRLP